MIDLIERGFCQIKKSVASVGLCFWLFGLAGCADDNMSDLTQYVENVKTRPKEALSALPGPKKIASFILNEKSGRRRSPFAFFVSKKDDKMGACELRVQPIAGRNKEYLERYPLAVLQLVGSINVGDGFWALIKAGDGIIHQVQKGNYLGSNDGKITQFLYDKNDENELKKIITSVELREVVPDVVCTWKEQLSSLALFEQPEPK